MTTMPGDFDQKKFDAENIAAIRRAFDEKRIDMATREYLELQYSDSVKWFRELFYTVGQYLGAPKTAVFHYDRRNGVTDEEPVKIADIWPNHAYLVHHRLDADPMRNQFFYFDNSHNVELFVSSIVTVIVASQKDVGRALDKITGKYYDQFIGDVTDAVRKILTERANAAAADAVVEKITAVMRDKFTTDAAQVILSVIGSHHNDIAVELIRAADQIARPHIRMRDIYRLKCLFDLIPQARTFIANVTAAAPDRVILLRDNFYDTKNSRDYRDAKLVLDMGTEKRPVPLEIICQLRTFFDYERQTHVSYEAARKKNDAAARDDTITKMHESGIRAYNELICRCVHELVERVGWNILYNRMRNSGNTLFDGFPKIAPHTHPKALVDAIIEKLETNVENEVFQLSDSARPLSMSEQITIFTYIANFILSSVIPFVSSNWRIEGNEIEHKLFNFIMGELYRHHKNTGII